MKLNFTVLALALIFLSGAANVQGQMTYQYSGTAFTNIDDPLHINPYSNSDQITGTFTLADPLAPDLDGSASITPLSFSFADGVQTLAGTGNGGGKSGGPSFSASFITDDLGNITGWAVLTTSSGGGGFIDSWGGALNGHAPGDDAAIGRFQEASTTTQGAWGPSVEAVPETSTWVAGALVSLSVAFSAARRLRVRFAS